MYGTNIVSWRVMLACVLFMGVCWSNDTLGRERDRAARQAELNATCKAAREKQINALRDVYIEECITERGKSREYCERFYRDYGAGSGDRPPLFYDLPECVEAFEFQSSQRQRAR